MPSSWKPGWTRLPVLLEFRAGALLCSAAGFSSRDPEPSLFPCNEGRWQRRALGCRTFGTVKSLGVWWGSGGAGGGLVQGRSWLLARPAHRTLKEDPESRAAPAQPSPCLLCFPEKVAISRVCCQAPALESGWARVWGLKAVLKGGKIWTK